MLSGLWHIGIEREHCWSHQVNNYYRCRRSAGSIDATTIPIADIIHHDADLSTTVSYASDFVTRQETLSISAYSQFTQARHADCMQLFDGYKTKLVRCETLDDSSLNMRWEASWIPAGSSWLYNLADIAGWEVIKRRHDPAIFPLSAGGRFLECFGGHLHRGI